MGKLALILCYILSVFPADMNESRRHIHLIMCKYSDIQVGIKKLDFTMKRGAMAVFLTDGRIVIVPVSMFPDIKHLTLAQREDYMILDDQYFSFENLSKIFSIKDILKYN